MLEIALLRANPNFVRQRLTVKNFADLHFVDQIIEIDAQRRNLQKQVDEILYQNKTLADQIGALYKTGKRSEADELKKQVAELKIQAALLEEQMQVAETKQNELMVLLPNLPHASVPQGKTPDDNKIVKQWGNVPDFNNNEATPHWELCEKYNLMSLELGVKLTGAGFPVYLGKGAKLQRALIAFFLDQAIAAGFNEVIPPLMVNQNSAYGTGQLPDKEGQMYHATLDDLYLIPTAEVPITNIYRNEVVKQADLPIKMVGYTPCFRREAGSYGAHVRGLNRVHQFDKIEIVQIAHPEKSYEILNEMVQHVEGLLQKLQLPYRILQLCSGDMSFASALTYDFETYSAAQQRWLEVSSVSNFETFQSNRMQTRFKDAKSGKNILVHTLNGSALALARIVATLLENNQTPNGIIIPEVLRSYTGFDIIN
ncbi:MAG: serine--tRNA ligase [Sphingobacteriales bacterium]|nr:serine--tRNA ligase [Sphingobacteriales bacterium]MBK6889129.1 serine--tRNA ligase [Sphingobacteriales bacterium]MBK7528367.1 serine--tRNA ligase [Sphingobacteriales bacterium]MBK8680171.1 serine--tRNA ligase [Sphingobacteriales bacterium]MDA0197600.1 serine--tRNA ligase [Bacteroidota bacterium]